MKKLFFAAAFSIWGFSCQSQSANDFNISGTIQNVEPNGKVYLAQVVGSNNLKNLDSLVLTNGNTFSFKGKVTDGGGFYLVNLFNKQRILIMLEGGETLTITADGNSGNSKVTGSKNMEYYYKLNQLNEGLQTKVNVWNKEFAEATQKNDQAKQQQIQQTYITTRKAMVEQIKTMYADMGSSMAALYGINLIVGDNPDEEMPFLVKLADKFEKDRPNNPQFMAFVNNIKKMKGTAVGSPAPEISLNTPAGQKVALSSLRGKYVLIDFWASWCGPCRKENPNVVKVYNKFKSKNFEIFGVSLDDNKDKWLQAIEKDGLIWKHVSDLKGWASVGAAAYQVTGIPATFLIDQQGNIIAKNLRGEALEKKLEEILK